MRALGIGGVARTLRLKVRVHRLLCCLVLLLTDTVEVTYPTQPTSQSSHQDWDGRQRQRTNILPFCKTLRNLGRNTGRARRRGRRAGRGRRALANATPIAGCLVLLLLRLLRRGIARCSCRREAAL